MHPNRVLSRLASKVGSHLRLTDFCITLHFRPEGIKEEERVYPYRASTVYSPMVSIRYLAYVKRLAFGLKDLRIVSALIVWDLDFRTLGSLLY